MKSERIEAWIGMGSNRGDRLDYLRRGLVMLERTERTGVAAVSDAYATEPRLVEDQPEFLNAVAKIETGLPVRKLLDQLLAIERRLGRRREEERVDKGPRVLDLDLLLFGDAVVDEPGLQVPHPGLPERRFVLVPLCEIDPDVVPPGADATVEQLLAACGDTGVVRREGTIRDDGGVASQ